jgi:hypothetical protein
MSESMETKENETESKEQDTDTEKPRRKTGRSMFGPILLIAIGVFLLLANFNFLPDLNWEAALQLWPLLLVFAGLNIIVRQAPRPTGTILSLIVALVTVGVFGYVLLFSEEGSFLNKYFDGTSSTLTTEHLSYPADDVDRAEVTLDLSSWRTELLALDASDNLIEADVTYLGELVFDTNTAGGLATVSLDTRSASGDWLYWLNPSNWSNSDHEGQWQIALAPNVSTKLDLDLGSGSAGLVLESLMLSALNVDGGSGSAEMVLPGGNYDMEYDVGSGSVVFTLPESGLHTFLVEGGSGSLTMLVPSSIEVMIVVKDKGSGGIRFAESLFSQMERGDDGEGVWVTAGYEDSSDRVELILDTGTGSVTVEKK